MSTVTCEQITQQLGQILLGCPRPQRTLCLLPSENGYFPHRCGFLLLQENTSIVSFEGVELSGELGLYDITDIFVTF